SRAQRRRPGRHFSRSRSYRPARTARRRHPTRREVFPVGDLPPEAVPAVKRLLILVVLLAVLGIPAVARAQCSPPGSAATQVYLHCGLFTWDDGGGGATSYTIKCGPVSGGPYTRIIPLPPVLQANANQVFGGRTTPTGSAWSPRPTRTASRRRRRRSPSP